MHSNIKKLIQIYKLSQKDSHEDVDQKSIHWKKYYDKKDFESEANLVNFRNNQLLSRGLDDAANMQDELSLIEQLRYFDSEYLRRSLPTKNIGNSNFSTNILGYFFDYGIVHHLKWVEEILKIIPSKKIFCEIGAGFGSLSRIILNNHDAKYIIIDLPEANLQASFYLKEFFPNKKFYLYDNYLKDSTLKNLDNHDIFILPPWCKFEKSIKIDFFINTRSMMEMNKEIIKKYFNLIESHISVNGFFLNINRYEKSTVGEKILLHEYPYDNNWDVIISKPSYLQAGIHFLLTQRKFENLARNIGDELNKIKIIYMNFPKKKYLILMSLKSNIIKTIYKIIKIFLLFTLKKKKIKKIAKILNGMI